MAQLNKALLQEKLGYVFRDAHLLQRALTHSSYMNENRQESECNERLEFLGDSILGMAVSCMLYRCYPEENEGVLSAYKQQLVCENTLARIAQNLDLGAFLYLGHGEEQQGGRRKKSILADAVEALLAAVFLDDACAAFSLVERLFAPEVAACESMRRGDYKTRLQQLVEQDGKEKLIYRVVATNGPVHEPLFTVEAMLNSNVIGRGHGHSKQEAEQTAACEALALFGITGT